MDKSKFINAIKEGALKGKLKNVLPSLTMAQAILESGWGNNAPGYNMFGIKWSKDCGHDYQLLWTKEWDGKKYIDVQARFRKYNSYTESIDDHTDLLQASRYKPVRDAHDYKEACKQIKACGYATSPTYTENLIRLIEENKLYEYDGGGFDIMDYKLQPIAKGMLLNTTSLTCCSKPSNSYKTTSVLKKGINEPINIYAKVHNEDRDWYLVNPTNEQWVAAGYVSLIK
jgi:hypothetical protein